MSTESSYYVPDQSKMPVVTATGFGLMALGAGSWVQGGSPMVFLAGSLIMALVLYTWFGTVIRENTAGMNSPQLKRSYVWGMGWFIFSEVMFFACFFGALFYVRTLALPWLGGEGKGDMTNDILWKGFEATWPLLSTPDQAAAGDAAQFVGPEAIIDPWHLPLLNTILLLSSSVTVHFAHSAIKSNNRSGFNRWLGATWLLGVFFLYFQVIEYHEAYSELGLTLASGIYGTTFFLLTGFHGAHVTLGTFMLIIQWLRGLKGHFKPDDNFGFEATSWYWHFVDVVWVGLFIFVYVLGS